MQLKVPMKNIRGIIPIYSKKLQNCTETKFIFPFFRVLRDYTKIKYDQLLISSNIYLYFIACLVIFFKLN